MTCRSVPPVVIAMEDALSDASGNASHRIHNGRVACQVCNAQAVKNCFGCHVGTDKKGLPYFKCRDSSFQFKIGLNPDRKPSRPFEWVVLRHPPANPGLFDFYVKGALSEFDSVPTWKPDTPHNIRRLTERNKACNNCHGNRSLFLDIEDLPAWERRANRLVVVPDTRMPPPITPQP